MRIIDADALERKVQRRGAYKICTDDVIAMIADAPTIDAVPVVHGYNTREDYPSLFGCSVCGWECDDTYYCDTDTFNYCPNCGAKMDGKENADADS